MKSQATSPTLIENKILLNKAENFVFPSTQPASRPVSSPRKRLNLLYIITQGVWGGSQRYVLDLATEMAKSHHVTVAIGEIQGTKDLQKKLTEHPEISLIQLKHLQRAINPFHDILALFELKKLYKHITPDIIHLNSTKAGILGSLAKKFFLSRKPQTKLIYTVHGWIFLEPLSALTKILFRFLEKITAPIKDAFIVLSPEEKEIAKKILKLSDTQLHVIPIGILPATVTLTHTEARKKLQECTNQIYPQKKWISTIAGLYQTKGLDILINAIAKSHQLQENTHYFFIGEGPERKFLEQKIKSNNLSTIITLTGHIDNAATLLPAFDLFVLPSKKEGLPYVLLEAMQASLPIVATNVGGIPSLLSTYSFATIIPTTNTQSLAMALESSLSREPSYHVRAHVSSLDSMVTSTSQLYFSFQP